MDIRKNKKNGLKKWISKGNNIETKKIMVVLIVMLCIVVVVLHSANINNEEIENQLQINMEAVANQNAVILHSRMHAQYELLKSLENELKDVTKDTINEKLDGFKIYLEDFNLKRFAFTFPDGVTYSTDGEVTNLSHRDFYKQGMKGKASITGVLTDAIQEEHTKVNVMTIPVRGDADDIVGVFGVAYDTDKFNESLRVECFDGKGYSCVVNESGEIQGVMQEEISQDVHNIFGDILESDKRNEKMAKKIRAQMKENTDENVVGKIYLAKKKHFYYSVPVKMMGGDVTWYVFTILPSDVLAERLQNVQNNQFYTTLLVVIFVVIGASMILFLVKEQYNRMFRLAYEDPLTNDANFAKFCMDMEARDTQNGCLIALDIINFNNITVVAGESSSDVMIKETWQIIKNHCKKSDIVAHVRDDMFLLFMPEIDEEKIVERMNEISEEIANKARDFKVFGIQAGYGVYMIQKKETLADAYSKAKLAREYVAGKDGVHYAFYKEVDRQKMQREKYLEEKFHSSIENGEFEVWYQPKYSAKNKNVVGSEALVRWRDENGELISPGQFIPLFERNGMIMQLDEYMFRSVCNQQKKWIDEGKDVYPVSINVSRASLYCADVEERYVQIIRESGIKPEYIQLEVTESVMNGKTDLRNLLKRFQKMGIKILMDDFGTGYSSLSTLNAQCFDTLKLDKSLIDNIGSKDGETLLYYVIQMGHEMGLRITAEGVENSSQLEYLQNLKCDDIQGFYFSKPIPKNEYENMLTKEL